MRAQYLERSGPMRELHSDLRLADIAEPGPSCSTVSCAEAVRVALRLEQWILEGFTTARDTADQVSTSALSRNFHSRNS